jgi:hypothetical protein
MCGCRVGFVVARLVAASEAPEGARLQLECVQLSRARRVVWCLLGGRVGTEEDLHGKRAGPGHLLAVRHSRRSAKMAAAAQLTTVPRPTLGTGVLVARAEPHGHAQWAAADTPPELPAYAWRRTCVGYET